MRILNSYGDGSCSDPSQYTLFHIEKNICNYKNQFLEELLSKFSDFLNSDDFIGKITSEYIQFLFKKRFEFNKKGIISCEKIRNSGDYVYDYAHSLIGKDF